MYIAREKKKARERERERESFGRKSVLPTSEARCFTRLDAVAPVKVDFCHPVSHCRRTSNQSDASFEEEKKGETNSLLSTCMSS